MPPATQSQVIPIQLISLPGIKRDGTRLQGNNYVDGKWCRWQRELPRKMGGYRTITTLLGEISRGMHVYDKNNETYTHSGSASFLERFTIDPNGVTSSISDRTPVGFAANPMNQWQFCSLYDATGTAVRLIAHAAPNANDISNDTATPIYYGNVTGTGVLTVSGMDPVSGGVFPMYPYLFTFGSDGVVNWSDPNDPNVQDNSARPTSSKIVRGMPLRAGAGNGPSGLMWSLTDVIAVSFVGGNAVFNFSILTDQSSILSANSVIEYDGIFYWLGVDRFLMFNGVVREVRNEMNYNYFFENLNYTYRNKVFATKIPRYGEIWWCYPRGNATECTHAIIYNVRGDFWYDVELPNGGRSAAQFAQVFRSPLMGGITADPATAKYVLWQHEFGYDELYGSRVNAIESYFETSEYSLSAADNPGVPVNTLDAVNIDIVEPDFNQIGDMTFQAFGHANARSQEWPSDVVTFPAEATDDIQRQVINCRIDQRQIRFRFTSNTQGGFYQMGKPLIHITPGSKRITQ